MTRISRAARLLLPSPVSLVLLLALAPAASSFSLFQSPITVPSGGTYAFGIAAADLNGDGIPDLVVGNFNSANIAVLLGLGNGHFAPPVTYFCGDGPHSIAVGDLNRDGIPDLVVAADGGPTDSHIAVLLGRGDGTFSPAALIVTAADPYTVVLADFNRDGILDVAVTSHSTGGIALHKGKGDGTFLPCIWYAADNKPYGLAAADFNNDGYPDLAVGNEGSNDVSILLNHGDGTFAAPSNIHLNYPVYAVISADLSHDGNMDLAVVSGAVYTFRGYGDGTFLPPLVYYMPSTAIDDLVMADVNADGLPDLLITDSGTSQVHVLLGQGWWGTPDGTFKPASPLSYDGGNYPFDLAAADFNRDGVADLAVADYFGACATVLLSTSVITPVEVSALTLQPAAWYVDVSWSSFLEGSAEFQVLRSGRVDGPFTAVGPVLTPGTASEHVYRDPSVAPDRTYFYKIAYRHVGEAAWSYGGAATARTPRASLVLRAPVPNPARGATRLSFDLDREGSVDLSIFSVAGERVRTLESGSRSAGPASFTWDGRDESGRPVPAGIYTVRLVASGQVKTTRAVRVQ